MSPSVVRINPESPGGKYAGIEANGTTERRPDDDNEDNVTNLHDADVSINSSRYGRVLKPKSPKYTKDDAIQITKSPKLRKSRQMSPELTSKMNGVIKKESEIVPEPESPIIENDAIDSLSTKIEENPRTRFSIGQLAWAQVGNYPYWPCVITVDVTEKSHSRYKNYGKLKNVVFVHVQYFGDSCRHGWVPETHLMAFTGIADFLKLAESKDIIKIKRHGNKMSPYRVKSSIKQKWEIAVDEATEVMPMTNDERAEHFKPREDVKTKYEELMELASRVRGNKRERFNDSAGPTPKRLKREEPVVKSEMETSRKKSQKSDEEETESIGLSTETPPTPPSSHKDSSDESTVIKKEKVKKRKKDVDGDFELYYERNRDMIADTQPDTTESEIRTYLEKTWANMSLTLRSKYRSRIKAVNDVQSKEETIDEEDVSSIESDSRYSKKPNLKTAKKKKASPVESKERSSDREDESSVESDSRYNKKPQSAKKKKTPNGVRRKEQNSTDQEEESSLDLESRYVKKSKSKDDARVSDTAKKPRPYNLFRGTKQERVCQICERTGDLTRCKGPCYSYFHLSCVKPGESSSECSMDEDTMEDDLFEDLKEIKKGLSNEGEEKSDEIPEDESFKCIDCLSGVAPACFICNEREEDRLRCSASACGRHYHIVCLKAWPQSHWQGGRLTCPYHMCHTCNSDNPQNGISWSSNEKLVRCVRCPSSYHASTSCLPAGSEILTGSQIVCPKHYKAPGAPINATWCFLCTRGGSLICCDTCPTSFHPECLGIDAPDGAFICEDCETGRMPLYGEVVWVKLGYYRWWPSRICFPHEIPINLEAIPHRPGEFCVMFLGTNNYYWVHRGRAFLYQDGDASAKVSVRRKNVDEAYQKALEEANDIHERLKEERVAAKGSELRVLRPPPYVKLKVNKPVGNVKPAEVESIGACDCDAKSDNPCSPDSDCLNRILSVECSPAICPAGPKCNNQAFVRRQYPAMEPFHTVGRGWGLRTLEPITEGKFVVEYVGEVIDEAEYKRRLYHKKELKNDNFYFLTIDQSRMIDAEPKGNLSRFMNHSCMPNCETQKWTVNGDTRIGLFALREIEIGEELTFNYNLACDGEGRKPCLCGAPNCSGFIGLKAQKQKGEDEKIDKSLKTEKTEKTSSKEKLDKTPKVDKVDKSAKNERAERTPKSEKIEKSSKTEKIEKTPKAEKNEKPSRSEKYEKTPRAEKTDKTIKAEKTPKSDKIERNSKIDRVEKIVKSDEGKRPYRRRSKKPPLLELCCWSCGESISSTDEFLECDQKTCIKRYHTNCINLKEEDLKFNCPWHRCKECGRRTSAHCRFCSKAYCQVHLEGNLIESIDKLGYVCKTHESMDAPKLQNEDEDKEETDNEMEMDKDNSSLSSDSLVFTEKTSLPRETSPRVSIVEVQFSSEEGEESQKEDSILEKSHNVSYGKKKNRLREARTKKSGRSSERKKIREDRINTLRSLTPSQLEIIIGGSINSVVNDQ